jgi:vacuolar iron transporter family protein
MPRFRYLHQSLAAYAAEQQLSWPKCFQPFDRHKTSPRPRLKRWFRMPITPHIEKHFLASALVRDIVIGMADGLTVPFALAAGLSGAVSSTSIIITAGLAEVAAGGLAMGLGGYLAARTDLEHYRSELQREKTEIKQVPESERAEVRQILRAQGLDPALAETVTAALTRDSERWINFMMRFELGLEEPEAGRELKSALTIGGAYVVGGLIPLSPYFFLPTVSHALPISIALTLAALLIFGGVKGQMTGVAPVRSALQTAIVGSLAATAAFAIARLVNT